MQVGTFGYRAFCDSAPVLWWESEISAKKAMAQVHHAEPVILQMPEDFMMGIDSVACGCKTGDSPDHHLDCHAEDTLKTLAAENHLLEPARPGQMAHEAAEVVDVLTDSRRIVIHD